MDQPEDPLVFTLAESRKTSPEVDLSEDPLKDTRCSSAAVPQTKWEHSISNVNEKYGAHRGRCFNRY